MQPSHCMPKQHTMNLAEDFNLFLLVSRASSYMKAFQFWEDYNLISFHGIILINLLAWKKQLFKQMGINTVYLYI